MPFHYKAMLLVIVITTVMFALARPLFTQFMSPRDFAVRRNAWMALTLAAFAIPNFWLFMLVALVVIVFAGSKDSNPAALYLLLLLALPPLRENIPGVAGIKQVFPLDHLRLLSLAVLLPAAIRRMGRNDDSVPVWPDGERRAGMHAPDVLVLVYAAVQVLLMLPYESATASVRRLVLLALDMLLPYFVVSRSCRSRAALVDAMSAFVLTLTVLAPLAVLEFLRGWILYAGLEERWGTPHMIGYLMRGEFLRAQVTGGHAIVFGYAMAVAFGLWMYLQSRMDSSKWRWLSLLTILAGLVATLARGPWVGAAAMLLVFLSLGPNAAARSMKVIALLLLVGAVVAMTPLGDRLIDQIPFVGTANEQTITYRQRLAALSWMLIQQNPLFGSPNFMAYMEELRQGEGIIDIVNVYAGLALSFGLVGMAPFVGFFIVTIARVLKVTRHAMPIDPDLSLLGASLVASIVGVLLIIGTASNYLSIPYIYWALGALAFAYVHIARCEQLGQGHYAGDPSPPNWTPPVATGPDAWGARRPQ